MSLSVGDRMCVSDGYQHQLWGTVASIAPPVDGFVSVHVRLENRVVAVRMPESALSDPMVPAPIRDPQALEQWLLA